MVQGAAPATPCWSEETLREPATATAPDAAARRLCLTAPLAPVSPAMTTREPLHGPLTPDTATRTPSSTLLASPETTAWPPTLPALVAASPGRGQRTRTEPRAVLQAALEGGDAA